MIGGKEIRKALRGLSKGAPNTAQLGPGSPELRMAVDRKVNHCWTIL